MRHEANLSTAVIVNNLGPDMHDPHHPTLNEVIKRIGTHRNERDLKVGSIAQFDDEAVLYTGTYIGALVLALKDEGTLGRHMGTIWGGKSIAHAASFAIKWIVAQRAIMRVSEFLAGELGMAPEQVVQTGLLRPAILHFGETALPKVTVTDSERGWYATKPDTHLSIRDITPTGVKDLKDNFGVDFREILESVKKEI